MGILEECFGNNIIGSKDEKFSSDGGFILVATMVTLLLLVGLGLATMTTTSIELLISGNDKFNKINFYLAEGATYEGAQRLEDNNAVFGIVTPAGGQGCTYLVDPKGIAKGGSLSMTHSQVHKYTITGLANNNNSNSSVDIGYKKRF